jgi:hypothetical protein
MSVVAASRSLPPNEGSDVARLGEVSWRGYSELTRAAKRWFQECRPSLPARDVVAHPTASVAQATRQSEMRS